MKEKRNERGGFFKAKFQLSSNNSKDLKKSRKPPNLRCEVFINLGLVESNEVRLVAIKRGSRLAIKVLQSFAPTEAARAALRKHADHDQFLGRMTIHSATLTRRLYSLFQVVTRNSQSNFIKKN